MKIVKVTAISLAREKCSWPLVARKLFSVLVLFSFLSLQLSAQEKISELKFSNVTIKEALAQIERNSKYKFFYDTEIIDPDLRVSVNVQNAELNDVLSRIFTNTNIGFEVKERFIILTRINEEISGEEKIGQIKGQVLDIDNNPLAGVNVYIKGTTKGTITDSNGKYIIDAEIGNILVFSFVGYLTEETIVEDETNINLVLIEDIAQLDEVIVIGYGTMVKKNISGSVISIDYSDAVGSQTPLTISSALQGVAPGVNVVNTGNPGVEPIVQIRGVKSFNNAAPLYIIDGIPTNDSREINPNDIESIQILKDASAAAIYGSRAANGVVIVTTKMGRKGEFNVDLSANYGIQDITNRLDVMNAEDFAVINNMARDNADLPRNPGADWAFDPDIDTDWQDAFFKRGFTKDLNVSVSGGSENSIFMFSGGYFQNEGTVIGPWFKRGSFSANSEHTYKKFRFGEHFRFTRSTAKQMVAVPFVDVVRMFPTIPVYDEDNPGGFGYGSDYNPTYGSNPVGLQELNDRKLYTNKVLGNVYGEYTIIPSLTYKISFGIDHYTNNQKNLYREGSVRYSDPLLPSNLSEDRAEYYKTVLDNTLTWKKEIGLHDITVLLGYSWEQEEFNNSFGTGEEVSTNPVTGSYYTTLGNTQTQQEVNGEIRRTQLISQFARLNYIFTERYLLTATIRRDGSSKFAEGHRFGIFPSFSVGWIINQEPFLSEYEWLSTLKLRMSYGELGGQETGASRAEGAYDYMGTVNTNVNYVLGTNQEMLNGHTQIQLTNDDLTWQTTATTNAGIDLGVFNNKLFLTTDYYVANTKDALIPVDIPLSTGNFEGNPNANVGEFRNSGFEAGLTFKNRESQIKYSLTVSFTTLKNEVVSLKNNPNGIVDWLTKTEVGSSIGTFYLLETNGIFQSDEEVLAHTTIVDGEEVVIQPTAQQGDVRYVDFNQDGIINDEDRQLMGSPFPKYTYGLAVNASWKWFDMNIMLYGVGGNHIFNIPRYWLERTDDDSNYPAGFEPWTTENHSTTTPRAVFGPEGASNSIQHSDRWLEKGNYLKLKNIELGFTFPQVLTTKIGIDKIRFYINAQNILTITKYQGLDPEVLHTNILFRGLDDGSFPNVRTIAFGVQANF
ncbi:MAG: TonB-dependent receptor [Bacteroidales bacterium]|nr:TonB-dependent receptor [Bacteroidales bacterium]